MTIDALHLPNWWNDVKGAMHDVPIAVWLSILLAESGGNAHAQNEVLPDMSYGLFQLNTNGGQGAGYSKENLWIPIVNANIAYKYIHAAWMNERTSAMTLVTDISIMEIARRSGHPSEDGSTPLTDPRLQRIAGIYNPIHAIEAQGNAHDEELWQAGANAYNSGATAKGTAPAPGGNDVGIGKIADPGVQAGEDASKAVKGVLDGLTQWLNDNGKIIGFGFLAILLIALGAAGFIFGK